MAPLLVGILLALAVGVFASATALDRDRAFYPTVMIVIAILYTLFAVMGGSLRPGVDATSAAQRPALACQRA